MKMICKQRIKWQFPLHLKFYIVNRNYGCVLLKCQHSVTSSACGKFAMKVRSRFCVKSNGLVSKMKLSSFVSTFLRQWRRSEAIVAFHRPTANHFSDGSFQESIYPVMAIAQCFGVMPVLNISSKNPSDLQFAWKSFRYFFAVFVALSCGLEAVSTITWTFCTRMEFGKMVILVYYITNFLSFFCFLRLARTWPNLMMQWRNVERSLPQIASKSKRRQLLVSIRRTAAIILALSAVEHILSIASCVIKVLDCPKIQNILKAYYVRSFPQVFRFFQYSHVLGVYVKFIHVTSTFVWSFADLFIMMISCGLSALFKQVNERLLLDKGKVIFPSPR